jgi:hypothetical protein
MISIFLSVVIHLGFAPTLIQLSQAQTIQLGEWQQIQYTPKTAIPGRFSHAAVFLLSTNEYLVFGGSDGSNDLSDFHSINMTSLQSTQLSASTPLGARYSISYTSDLVSNFYVHGGLSGSSKIFLTIMVFNCHLS